MPLMIPHTTLFLLQKEINRLLALGAIVPCKVNKGQFISTYFLTEKPDGSMRFILNLKKLNSFLIAPHFKLEDTRTAIKLIYPNYFMSKIDLKDAYFMLPIHKNDRKFLRFSFKQNLYEFVCLPFGLSIAPYVFTKLLRPVLRYFRLRDIIIISCIDHFLLINESKSQCEKDTLFVVDTLLSLGFIINKEKSCLILDYSCKFLGYIFDTKRMTIELPQNKRQNILNMLNTIKHIKKCKIKKFAHFLGILSAICGGGTYARLYTKQLEREKFLALQGSNQNYNSIMHISKNVNHDIAWWIKNINTMKNQIKHDKYVLEIYTDASSTGWGVVCDNESTHGWWDSTESKEHINFLELKAIFYGLKCFTRNLSSCSILIRTDNTTALSYINRMGSVKYPKFHSLAKKIWQWCEARNLWTFTLITTFTLVKASYVNSKNNLADLESRRRKI